MKKFGLSKLSKLAENFAAFVVKYRWLFVILFTVALVISLVLLPRINVEYDLTKYLGKDSDMAIATDVLKREFDDKGMAYLMIEDVDLSDANKIADELRTIEGVATVTFVSQMNYKNRNALYTINLEAYDATDGSFEAVEKIIEAVSDQEAYLTGQSAYSYYTRLETEESILKVGIAIVIAVLLMLLFTSKTFFELVIMVLVLGVTIAINMGTNAFFSGISYISNLVSLVLLLALCIDYSVILLHRFMEEKKIFSDAKTAAICALKKGIPEILSSSLTTVAGMCALLLMTLPIGVEIGIAMTKGIIVALVTVLCLMPALLVIFAKPLEKTKHKSFVPNVTKPARAIVKGRKFIVPIFGIIMILAGVGNMYNSYSFNYNGSTRIVAAQTAIKEDFGTLNSLVVIVPKVDYEKERELAAYIESIEIGGKKMVDSTTALSTLEAAPGVRLVDGYTKQEIIDTLGGMFEMGELDLSNLISWIVDEYANENGIAIEADTEIVLLDLLEFVAQNESYDILLGEYKPMLNQLVFAKGNLESDGYSRLMFNIDSGVESADTFDFIKTIKTGISDYYGEFYVMGESVACYEMAETFPRDNMYVSIFIVVFMLIILLFTFKNVSLPIILTAVIQGAIWINFVIPFLAGNSIAFIGYLIISAVQMGATIDYAIVLTNRYRTTKDQFLNRYDAMAESVNAVFPTIITSGIILTFTGFALSILSSGVVSELGLLLGIGTLMSMLSVLLVLPSLILVSEKIIDKTDFAVLFRRKKALIADDEASSADSMTKSVSVDDEVLDEPTVTSADEVLDEPTVTSADEVLDEPTVTSADE